MSNSNIIDDYRSLLYRAYRAMEPDHGSNDAEHECLYEAVEMIQELVRAAGADLPPHPDDENYREKRRAFVAEMKAKGAL